MPLSKEQVLKVGTLSRIRLTDEEVNRFASQLSSILEYVGKLTELDTDDTEPLAHALPIHNILRRDEPRESLAPSSARRCAGGDGRLFPRAPRH